MLKKNKRGHLLWLGMILSIVVMFVSPKVTIAEEEQSTVTYRYENVTALSDVEKKQIIKGYPKEQVGNETETFVFVYGNENHTNGQKPLTTIKKGENLAKGNELPQTGETILGNGLYVVGVLIIGSSVALLIWKRKKTKELLLVLVIGSGIGGMTLQGESAPAMLRTTEEEMVQKGTIITKRPEQIEGYKYIGYIHTYANKAKPQKETSVTVYYEDETGKELSEPDILNGNIGETYTTEEKVITGYTYKEIKTGNTTGTFTSAPQSVTYVYTKDPIKGGTVTVYYEDEIGKELSEPEILNGNVKETYTTEEKSIKGYIFKEVKEGNATGIFTLKEQQVTYIYKAEQPKLIYRFIDKTTKLPVSTMVLSDYSNGTLPDNNPNIELYYYMRELSGSQERFEQGVPLKDIEIPVSIGDTISVPQTIPFKIYNGEGDYMSQISNGRNTSKDYRGFLDYRADVVQPIVNSIEESVTVIIYEMTVTPIALPF